MTQDEFLTNMIDTGYVSVRAKELRELLQNYKKCKSEKEKLLREFYQKDGIINYYKKKANALEVKQLHIDLEV